MRECVRRGWIKLAVLESGRWKSSEEEIEIS
jgi:predicted site-specific integrase-resolvase